MRKSRLKLATPLEGSAGPSMSATEAQNNFGRVLERVSSEGVVFITKHRRRQAVVISVDRYDALMRIERPDLDALTREFDLMMERMQSPEATRGYDALFSDPAESLGTAAVRGARKGHGGELPARATDELSIARSSARRPTAKATSGRKPGGRVVSGPASSEPARALAKGPKAESGRKRR